MPNESRPDHIRPLSELAGKKPPAPQWFEDNINAPCEEHEVEVRGARIRYTAWGEGNARGLLFVHGGRAHRNWWRPFAPFFANDRRVAALDLSGMGDSDWRERYSLDCLVDELFAVIDAAGLNKHGRPIVIGHSFGGWVTLAAVEREGERLGGAVVVDSPLGLPDPTEGYVVVKAKSKDDKEKSRTTYLYDTPEEPISRFRFLPNQPASELYLVDYIARHGIRPADERDGDQPGWTWKFDPVRGSDFDIHFERDLLRAARCPLAFMYGEKSAFAVGENMQHLREQAAGRSPFIMVPNAYHHLMMDQPLAFVTSLRTLLACWPVRFGA